MGAQAFIPRSLAPAGLDSSRTGGGRWVEASALLLFAAATFLALALVSVEYDPSDPGLAGWDWMGEVGAFLARALVQGFGLASWLIPVELVCFGLPLLRGAQPTRVGLRVSGDTLLLVLVASLLQVACPEVEVFGRAHAGGNVGLLFGELMRGLFSAPGSFLVGFTAIGLLLISRASFSFIELTQRAEHFFAKTMAFFGRAWLRLSSAWSRASQVRREASEIEARMPAIEAVDPDAAVLHHLEDDSPWIPLEATGVPPLALSESLRQSLDSVRFDDRDSEPAPCLGTRGLETQLAEFQDESKVEPAAPAFQFLLEDDGPGNALASDMEGFWSSALVGESSVPSAVGVSPVQPEVQEAACEEPAHLKIVAASPEVEVKKAAPRKGRRGEFCLPSTELLEPASDTTTPISRESIFAQATLLEKILADYGVTAAVEEVHPGPTVTTFEVAPTAGTKVSKVAGLSDDLALGLSRKVRIIAPIPGKSRIGFELPNDERQPVNLRELVEDERFDKLSEKAPLPVVLGRDIVGAPFYADLASMPHVIVAGATGAGKSVGLNVMLSSLLFRRGPEDLRMLMIDPKVVELAPFDRIPHLLLPVVTDMKQAAQALKWAVDEMERRYQLFADAGTKNITTYNRYAKRVCDGELPPPKQQTVEAVDHNGDLVMVPAVKNGAEGAELPEKLPYIVIVVDEFADLMMQQGKEVESSVARLAQKARAAGMHVILATQRPSVDVITGMIKANFPTRIAFRVAQKVDSRTILDEQGAEVLLGRGDMLVKLNGSTDTMRVQCPFISEEEVSALTDHLRAQGEPRYQESILESTDAEEDEDADEKIDARFDEAVQIVMDTGRCSTSWLQRKLTIGYNRAAKIVEAMERRGYVGPPNGSKDREIFFPGS